MATPIPDEMLRSGDLIDVEYEIKPGANPTLVSMAISQVKKDLWADKRFDYQGSREETRVDKSGLTGEIRELRVLIITVLVRDYPRDERPEQYQAGIFVPIMALVALAGVTILGTYGLRYLTARVESRRAQIEQDTVKIIAESNLPPQQKERVMQAIVTPGASPGVIERIKSALGGTLFALAVIGGAWALLTLKSKKGRSGYLYRGVEES